MGAPPAKKSYASIGKLSARFPTRFYCFALQVYLHFLLLVVFLVEVFYVPKRFLAGVFFLSMQVL